MRDIDYLIPFKVIIDRPSENGGTIKQTERYDTLTQAMGVFNDSKGFCMVTHRKYNGSKVIAYRYGKQPY